MSYTPPVKKSRDVTIIVPTKTSKLVPNYPDVLESKVLEGLSHDPMSLKFLAAERYLKTSLDYYFDKIPSYRDTGDEMYATFKNLYKELAIKKWGINMIKKLILINMIK
jgi:hypothetical protein